MVLVKVDSIKYAVVNFPLKKAIVEFNESIDTDKIIEKIKSIEITRDTTTKENLSFFDKVAKIVSEENRPLLIFPHGTRVKFNEKVPFKKGVGRIYETLNISCLPVALNSGKVWPKEGIIKHSGNITVSFLKPIKADRKLCWAPEGPI